MDENDPIRISNAEWREIIALAEVREGWGLEEDDTFEDFKRMAYGAKFNFVSGGPGYRGDLYIIQGESLERPHLLIRIKGKLKALE